MPKQRSYASHDLQAGKTAGILLHYQLWIPWTDEFLSSCFSFLTMSQNRLCTSSTGSLSESWWEQAYYKHYTECMLASKCELNIFRKKFYWPLNVSYRQWAPSATAYVKHVLIFAISFPGIFFFCKVSLLGSTVWLELCLPVTHVNVNHTSVQVHSGNKVHVI